jgi:thioredoxin 1
MADVIDKATFDEKVKEGIAVIDFFAEWCGPCKAMGPIFSEVADELKDKAYLAKVDVDQSADLAQQFGVQSIPTIIFFKDGKEVEKHLGIMEKADLIAKIESL